MVRPGDRRDIQGLRALAVVLVIVDHLAVPDLAGGYLGVDVFFVVSGFLITGLLLREHDTRGRISISLFYARRARRILPAATVVLVATAMHAAWSLSLARVQEVLTDVRWAAAFAANWHFSALGTDYFAQGRAVSPIQHFWSLAVEEQFYIVWPGLLAVLLIGRRGRRRRAGVVLAGVWAASLGWAVVLLDRSTTEAYFSSLTRAWELATGALLALAAGRLATMPLPVRRLLGAAGLLAVLISVVTFDERSGVPGLPTLLPVAGTAALLAAGTGPGRPGVVRLLGLPPLTWIGDASYSLYLWHWPVLVFGGERLHLPLVVEDLVLVAVTAVLAAMSYVVVEQPLRTSRLPFTSGRRALALWPVALALVLVSGLVADSHATSELNRSREAARQFYAHHPVGAPVEPASGASSAQVRAELRHGVEAARAGDAVPPDLADLDLSGERWEPRFCHAGFTAHRVPLCPVGDRKATTTVVALGDSHMGQWLTALDRDGRARHYRVIPLVKFGCPPYDMVIRWGSGVYTSCQAFRDWTTDTIRALSPSAIVVGQIIDYGKFAENSPKPASREFAAGLRSMLVRLRQLAPDVVVLSDLSPRGREPADCLSDPRGDLRDCLIHEGGDPVEGNRTVEQIAVGLGARFVDLTPLLCVDAGCPLVASGRVVYADYGHVSLSWADHVSRVFGELVDVGGSPSEPSVADELRAALRLADQGAPIPDPMVNFDRLDRDHWGSLDCRAQGVETSHELCPVGDVDSPSVIALLGDSQMAQWIPAFTRLGRRHGFRIVPFLKNGCPAYDIRKLVGGLEFWECRAFHDWALEQMTLLHPSAIVATGRSEYERLIADPGLSLEDTWTADVERRLRRLEEIAPQVLVLGELSMWDREPADCLTDPRSSLESCVAEQTEQVVYTNDLLAAIAAREGAAYVDTPSLSCVNRRCPLVVSGIVTRFDPGHLTNTWVRRVTSELGGLLGIPCGLRLPSCTMASWGHFEGGVASGRRPG